MADRIGISIDVSYDYKSANHNLQDLLKKLEKANKVDIIIDTKRFEKLSNEYDKLKAKFEKQNINISFGDSQIDKAVQGIDKYSEKLVKVGDANYQLVQKTAEWKDKSNEIVKVIENIDQKTGKVAQTTKVVTENFKEQALRIQRLGEVKGTVNDKLFGDNKYVQEQVKAIYGAEASITHFQRVVDSAGNAQVKMTVSTKNSNNMITQQKVVVDQTTNSIYQQSTALKANTARMVGMVESFGTAIQKSIIWGASMGLLYGNLRKFQEGVTFIEDIDKELTLIAMTTEGTRNQTKLLAQEYSQMGMELGKTTSELVKSSVELYRQGLNATQVKERLATISKTASAAGVDINLTTDIITAGVNGLGVSAERLSDVLLKIGAVAGTSFEEVGVGLARTASAAKVSGVSLEKIASYIGVLSEVTREAPETLGNSVKGLLSRFNKINQETGELNEDFNKVQTAIESVGVAFVDLDGQVRPVSDIIDDLSRKWVNLDKNTKLYIATQAGGTLQGNRFLALLDNYGRSIELYNSGLESSNTLNQQYAKFLTSVETSANRLKVAYEQMWMNAFNSETIKDYYSFMTVMVQLVDKVGLLKVAVFALSVVLLTTNKRFREFAYTLDLVKIKGFMSNMSQLPWLFSTAVAEMGLFKGSLFALGVTFDAVKIKGALMWAGITLGASLLITGAISAITKFISKMEDAKMANQEFLQSFQNDVTEQNNADKLINKYDELSAKERQGIEVKEEMKKVQLELSSLFPEYIDNIDEEGNKIISNVSSIKEYNDVKKEEIRLRLQALALQAQEKLPTLQSEAQSIRDRIKANQKKIANRDVTQLIFTENGQVIIDLRSKINEEIIKDTQALADNIQEQNRYKNALEQNNKIMQDSIRTEVQKNIIGAYSIQQAQETEERLKAQGVTQEQINNVIKENTDLTNANTDAKKDNATSVKTLAEIETELAKSLSSSKSEIDNINEVLSQHAKTNEWNVEEIVKIAQNYPALLDALLTEGDIEKELIKIKQQKVDATKSAINKSMEAEAKYIDSLGLNYSTDIDNFKSAEEMKNYIVQQGVNKRLAMYKVELDQAMKAVELAKADTNDPYAVENAMRKAMGLGNLYTQEYVNMSGHIDAYYNFKKALNGIDKLFDDIGSKDADGKGSSKSDISDMDLKIDRYQYLKMALDEVNDKLSLLNELEKDASDMEKLNYQKQEIELLQKRKDLLIQLSNAQKVELQELQTSLSSKGFAFNAGEIINYQSLLESLQARANSLTGDAKKKAIDAVKEVEEQTRRYFDLYRQEIPDTVLQFQSAQSQIASINKSIIESSFSALKQIEQQLGDAIRQEIESERDSRISGLNSELDIMQRNHEQRLSMIEEERDRYTDMINERISLLDEEANTEDFNTQVNELTQEKLDLQNQINQLSQDNSLESIARRDELTKQVEDKQKSIDELTKNRERDLRKQNLQDQLDTYNKQVEAKIKMENDSYNATRDSLSRQIEAENRAYDARLQQSAIYQETQKQMQEKSFEELTEMLINWLDKFGDGMSLAGQSIKKNLIDQLKIALQLMQQTGSASFANTPLMTGKGKVYGNSTDLASSESLKALGYEFINTEGMDVNSIEFSANDIIVGGTGAVGGIGDVNTNGATRLSGRDRSETAKAIEDFLKEIIGGSYAQGGIITQNQLSLLHGSPSNWEAVLNKPQLQELINRTFNAAINLNPNITNPQNIKPASQPIVIQKLFDVLGNVDEKVLPTLVTSTKNSLEEVFNKLNKKGVVVPL